MSYVQFTKNVVLVTIFCCYSNMFSQFNTVTKPNEKLIVTSLEIKDSIQVDSVVSLLRKKKEQYNIGTLPLEEIYVTSNYGNRWHPITGELKLHTGIDLRANGKMVYAVQTGVITYVGYDKKLGEYVKLKCGSFEFIYGHLKHIYVKSGSVVDIGQTLGKTGETGSVTAEHLHFAIKKNDNYIDPFPILELIYENLNIRMSASSNKFDAK